MKIQNLVLLLILVAVFTSISTMIFYNNFVIEKIVYYNMTVRVDDHFGLNVDNESINFGRTIPGQSSERYISFVNPSNHDVRIVVLNHGTISEWVRVSDYYFVLAPGEKKNVKFEVFVPSDATFGIYSGKAQIIFKKAYFK